MLVAQYAVNGSTRRAEFTYDQPGRYVVADNQEARLLTGEATQAPEGAAPARRLSSVPSSSARADDQLPLGDDAIELVRDTMTPDDEAELDPVTADHADADWIAEPRQDGGPIDGAAPVDEPTAPAEAAEPEEPPAAEAAPPQKAAKKGRSSVPSWDEIMFGGGKGE